MCVIFSFLSSFAEIGTSSTPWFHHNDDPDRISAKKLKKDKKAPTTRNMHPSSPTPSSGRAAWMHDSGGGRSASSGPSVVSSSPCVHWCRAAAVGCSSHGTFTILVGWLPAGAVVAVLVSSPSFRCVSWWPPRSRAYPESYLLPFYY